MTILCKCGGPVRKGENKRYYKTKEGTITVYIYPKDQCSKCANKKYEQTKN